MQMVFAIWFETQVWPKSSNSYHNGGALSICYHNAVMKPRQFVDYTGTNNMHKRDVLLHYYQFTGYDKPRVKNLAPIMQSRYLSLKAVVKFSCCFPGFLSPFIVQR
uniref:Uncharacterized protein n=1 Tax=Cacopsylla melanoneura TaxID=428564 RepID=A0A8D8PM82_9HEMI